MSTRLTFAAALAFLFGIAGSASAATPPTYDYYSTGKLKAPRAAKTESALLLLGGGDWPVPAFRWFVEKMGHGHLVILKASGDDDLQKEFVEGVGGAAS